LRRTWAVVAVLKKDLHGTTASSHMRNDGKTKSIAFKIARCDLSQKIRGLVFARLCPNKWRKTNQTQYRTSNPQPPRNSADMIGHLWQPRYYPNKRTCGYQDAEGCLYALIHIDVLSTASNDGQLCARAGNAEQHAS
jgi:hypothetical protein